jgi:hypothetical protein
MGFETAFGMEYLGSRDTDTHRVCSTCGKLKPVEEFYRDGKDSHGKVKYRRDCKECYKNQRYLESKRKKAKK